MQYCDKFVHYRQCHLSLSVMDKLVTVLHTMSRRVGTPAEHTTGEQWTLCRLGWKTKQARNKHTHNTTSTHTGILHSEWHA